METDDDGARVAMNLRRFLTMRVVVPLILGFTILVSIVSIGISAAVRAVVGRSAVELGQTGQVFESVAALFSGLAFIALVVTFLLQLEELRMQRRELESQRQEMSRTQSELHRSAEADLRRLHFELMRMGINDRELADVWPDPGPDVSHTVRRQLWYANLIYQHQRVAIEYSGIEDVEQAKVWLRRVFRSPIMRQYWAAGAEVRAEVLIPGTSEWKFAKLTDEIFDEWTGIPDQAQRDQSS